jgi:hypothetical protein
MQRMNPPRGMGPMGPGPQVSSYLSVCPYVSLPSVCTRLLSFFHSLSVSTFLAPLPACGMLSRNESQGAGWVADPSRVNVISYDVGSSGIQSHFLPRVEKA